MNVKFRPDACKTNATRRPDAPRPNVGNDFPAPVQTGEARRNPSRTGGSPAPGAVF